MEYYLLCGKWEEQMFWQNFILSDGRLPEARKTTQVKITLFMLMYKENTGSVYLGIWFAFYQIRRENFLSKVYPIWQKITRGKRTNKVEMTLFILMDKENTGEEWCLNVICFAAYYNR